MGWGLKHGPHLPLYERRHAKGLSSPLDNRPELYEDLAEVLVAFGQLSMSRTCGFGPNPIAIAEIEAWLRLHDVADLEKRREFVQLIQAADQTWLRWAQDERRKGTEP